jgi:hypothetical protein
MWIKQFSAEIVHFRTGDGFTDPYGRRVGVAARARRRMNVFNAIFPHADFVTVDAARHQTPRPVSGAPGRKFMDTIERLANAVHDTSLQLRRDARDSVSAHEMFSLSHSARDVHKEHNGYLDPPQSARGNKCPQQLSVSTPRTQSEEQKSASSLGLSTQSNSTAAAMTRRTNPSFWLSHDVTLTADSPRAHRPVANDDECIHHNAPNSCSFGCSNHYSRPRCSAFAPPPSPSLCAGMFSPRGWGFAEHGLGPPRTAGGPGRSPRSRSVGSADAAAPRPPLSPRQAQRNDPIPVAISAASAGGGGSSSGDNDALIERLRRKIRSRDATLAELRAELRSARAAALTRMTPPAAAGGPRRADGGAACGGRRALPCARPCGRRAGGPPAQRPRWARR